MSEMLELGVREAFGLALALAIPLLALGGLAALVGGAIASALGIRDVALAQCLRAIAVLLVLGAVASDMADSTPEFARRTWTSLAETEP